MTDIQVFTELDAKVVPAEELDILLLSTEGAAPMTTYNDLDLIKEAFPGKKVAEMADRMFNQANTLATKLIRKVRIAGIENPQNVGGEVSTIAITFGGLSTSEPLQPETPITSKLAARWLSKLPPAPVSRQMRRNSPLSLPGFLYRGRGDFRGIGGRGDRHLHQHHPGAGIRLHPRCGAVQGC